MFVVCLEITPFLAFLFTYSFPSHIDDSWFVPLQYVFDPSGSQYQASSDTKDPYAFPVENSYYNDLLITEEQLRFRVNQTCPMNATSLDAFILALATDLAESISISASRIVIKDVIDVAPDTL